VRHGVSNRPNYASPTFDCLLAENRNSKLRKRDPQYNFEFPVSSFGLLQPAIVNRKSAIGAHYSVSATGISWSSVGCWQQTQLPGSSASMLQTSQ